MRYLLIAAIFFMLGAILGAQRGLNKLQDEAVRVATEIYEQGMQETINSDSIQNSEFSQQAQDFFQQQTDKFKQEASDYAKDIIKKEIDVMLESSSSVTQ